MKTLLRFALATVGAVLLCSQGDAFSQGSIEFSPYVTALREGVSYSPPPSNVLTEAAIKAIQKATGSTGDVTLNAVLIKKFVLQPTCGRVSFGLFQASTKTFWGQFGGQLNICEDGTPPQRVCSNEPTHLLPASALCADHSAPIDTVEVAAAIREAIKKGGLTAQQYKQQSITQTNKKTSGGEQGGKNDK